MLAADASSIVVRSIMLVDGSATEIRSVHSGKLADRFEFKAHRSARVATRLTPGGPGGGGFNGASLIQLVPDDMVGSTKFPEYNTKQAGILDVKKDLDTFRFIAPASGVVTIQQMKSSGSELDSLLSAYVLDDAAFGYQPVAANNDYGKSSDSRIQFEAVGGQTYYVQAAATNKSTGEYQLLVNLESKTVGDDFDPVKNTPSHATSLMLDAVDPLETTASSGMETTESLGAEDPVLFRGKQPGKIEFVSDQDVFGFTAIRGGLLRIQLEASESPESQGLQDSFIEVLDSVGQLISSGTVGAATLDDKGVAIIAGTKLESFINAGSTYYLRVRAADGTFGAYNLGFETIGISEPVVIVERPVLPPLPKTIPSSNTFSPISLGEIPEPVVRTTVRYATASPMITTLTAASAEAPGRAGSSQPMFPSGRPQSSSRDDSLGERRADGGDGLQSGRRATSLLNAALEGEGRRGAGRPEVHPQDFYDMMLLPTLSLPRPGPMAGDPGPPRMGRGRDDSRPPAIDDRHGIRFLEARPARAEPAERPLVAPRGDDRAEARGERIEDGRQLQALAGALGVLGFCGFERYRSRVGRWIARRTAGRPRRPGDDIRI